MFESLTLGRQQRRGLLQRYCTQLVKLAEHNRADTAALTAHREKAFADLARIDMLKAQAADPARSEFVAHMFVAHMSHELRTPLNAIIGFSDMLRLFLQRMSVDSKLIGYVDDINGAGYHLLRVINDILDLSKIEAGKLDLSEEVVDLGDLIEACSRMVKGQMDEKHIEFRCEVPASLPSLLVDDLKLKQVLINLLSNAAKFTPDRGRVVLAASQERCGAIRISVADSGVGIDAADLPKVFKPFTQLNANVSRKYKGTGLGLPLAKALVELHGGNVSIESEAGRGTTAIVQLPPHRTVRGVRAPEPAQPRAAEIAAPIHSLDALPQTA